MSETLDASNGTAKRPSFLTVLCILTFIGSGLGLLGGLLGLIGTSFLPMFSTQGTLVVQIVGVVASALCLFGAIKMFGLYKQGFMLYVTGAVLAIVGSVISAMTFSSAVSGAMETIEGLEGVDSQLNDAMANAGAELASAAVWTGLATALVINVLFIILYNVNRKHLVK
jgi:hypothetical protein